MWSCRDEDQHLWVRGQGSLLEKEGLHSPCQRRFVGVQVSRGCVHNWWGKRKEIDREMLWCWKENWAKRKWSQCTNQSIFQPSPTVMTYEWLKSPKQVAFFPVMAKMQLRTSVIHQLSMSRGGTWGALGFCLRCLLDIAPWRCSAVRRGQPFPSRLGVREQQHLGSSGVVEMWSVPAAANGRWSQWHTT